MNSIMTQENISKWITIFDGLSQKLRAIPPSDYFGMNKSINIFFRVIELLFSCILSFGCIIFGFILIAEAMVFLKAKKKPWAAIIPFYGDYVIFDMALGQGFLGIIYRLLSCSILIIPFLEVIYNFNMNFRILVSCISFILVAVMNFKLAKKFNKGTMFGFGLLLLPIIFYPILGFGKSEYKSENEINRIEDKKDLV